MRRRALITTLTNVIHSPYYAIYMCVCICVYSLFGISINEAMQGKTWRPGNGTMLSVERMKGLKSSAYC